MPKALQVKIPEPCHESWQQMTPNEQGRHCMACQKTVVDFSLMSDKEILNYLSKASGNTCGRFSSDQLNKDLLLNNNKKRYSFAYCWNLLLATFLVTGKGYAQGKPVVRQEVAEKDKRPVVLGGMTYKEPIAIVIPSVIKGAVFDSFTKEPVAGASIRIAQSDIGTSANGKGNFKLKRAGSNTGSRLEISAVGYETQTIDLTVVSDWKNLKIYLKPAAEELEAVTVTGFGVVGKVSVISGMLVTCYRDTTIEKVQKVFADWVPGVFKKEVKIYPNPVMPGNTINISLKLKEYGQYKLELMDASGRVVLVQAVQVNAKGQLVTIPANTTWSAGVYWVRISGQHTRQVYQSKLILR